MKDRIIILLLASLLDILLGDPHVLYHPVQAMGALIQLLEHVLRRMLHIRPEKEADPWKKRTAGFILALLVPTISAGITVALLFAAGRLHPFLARLLSVWISYQMLAAKSLYHESMKVYDALKRDKLEDARKAVSGIVGRDTAVLSKAGIIRAAVETVAENTSDGVIAPLFYMILLGPIGGVIYKAVNTMDSMIGYRNDRYWYFGTAAARLDDLFNFIPARLSGLLMVEASFLLRLDGKNAWKIFLRDRKKHKSPNSAHTEAACAGALDISLAGDAQYFGKLVHKPVLGEALREIEPEDIVRANRLMFMTAFLCLFQAIVILLILRLLLPGFIIPRLLASGFLAPGLLAPGYFLY